MTHLYFVATKPDFEIKIPDKGDNPPTTGGKNPFFWGLMLLLFIGLGIFAMVTFEDYVRQNPDGSYELKEVRKKKLEKELNDLESAEQYVLIAETSGWFPCYSCISKDSLYLNQGEIWKYGVTKQGELGRYGRSLLFNKLLYLTQFEGLLHECYMEEKRKIFNYPLLPENIIRLEKLPRPPGNKVDA